MQSVEYASRDILAILQIQRNTEANYLSKVLVIKRFTR